MQCPKCRFNNPEGMKFCGECGVKFEKICPKCNFSNPLQFKFCGECGFNFTASAESSPIDYSKPQSYTPKHLADKILTTRSALEGERKNRQRIGPEMKKIVQRPDLPERLALLFAGQQY